MIVIPAIDIRAGRCVRLLRGDYDHETVYGPEPAAEALRLAEMGVRRVHLVDLDAARGRPDPRTDAAVRAVVRALIDRSVDVELGGGLRDAAAVTGWLSAGVALVVLGSLAVRRPAAAEAICREHPARVLLGLDVRGGRAQAQGWTEDAGDPEEHLRTWGGWPAAGVVHTEVERDGALQGPDVGALRDCIRRYPGPVIASGGISSLADLAACASAGAAGAVVGRALHEGRLDLAAALRRFPAATSTPR